MADAAAPHRMRRRRTSPGTSVFRRNSDPINLYHIPTRAAGSDLPAMTIRRRPSHFPHVPPLPASLQNG